MSRLGALGPMFARGFTMSGATVRGPGDTLASGPLRGSRSGQRRSLGCDAPKSRKGCQPGQSDRNLCPAETWKDCHNDGRDKTVAPCAFVSDMAATFAGLVHGHVQ